MKKVAAACATVACPAVYEENDHYIIVGNKEPEDAVPQDVADDEQIIRIDKSLLERTR